MQRGLNDSALDSPARHPSLRKLQQEAQRRWFAQRRKSHPSEENLMWMNLVKYCNVKGSDQWEGRGCRRSRNHYMLVGEVVLDVFFVILMGYHLVWTVIYCSASKAKKNSICRNNSRCYECHAAPTITLCFGLVAPTIILNKVHILYLEYHSVFPLVRTGSPPPPLPQTSVPPHPPKHKKCPKMYFSKHWQHLLVGAEVLVVPTSMCWNNLSCVITLCSTA